jgi:hypothetical protein
VRQGGGEGGACAAAPVQHPCRLRAAALPVYSQEKDGKQPFYIHLARTKQTDGGGGGGSSAGSGDGAGGVKEEGEEEPLVFAGLYDVWKARGVGCFGAGHWAW